MEPSLSLKAQLQDGNEKSDTKLNLQIRVPNSILSPPTSRSNSPVSNLKFKDHDKSRESESSDGDELELHDEDIKLQEEQAEENKKTCDEV